MNEYLKLLITGLWTGIGSTVGAWLANRHINKNIERMSKKLDWIKMKKR